MATDAGELVTGGLIAAAIEPAHGRRHDSLHGGTCLNCGASLSGHYCAECGQAAHVHRTVGAIWHELLHGVLHLDGKLFRTLPELALRPGALTRRYIDGERAKFISPLALFLFSALLMYATYSVFGHEGEEGSRVGARVMAEELRGEVQDADERIEDIRSDLREPGLSAARKAKLQARLAETQAMRAELARAVPATQAAATKGTPAAKVGPLEQMRTDRAFVSYKLKANAYKFSWALILISTPMVWLLFAFKRRFGLYDHAVFVTYSIAFMSLLFSGWTIASGLGIGHGLLLVALMGYGLWHMYVQLKGAYLLGTGAALWRVTLLYGLAAAAGGMFYALITMLS